MSQPNKITAFKTALVAPRWGLLRVETQAGITGYGEFTVEGQIGGAEAVVKEVEKAAKTGVIWGDEAMYLGDGTLSNW